MSIIKKEKKSDSTVPLDQRRQVVHVVGRHRSLQGGGCQLSPDGFNRGRINDAMRLRFALGGWTMDEGGSADVGEQDVAVAMPKQLTSERVFEGSEEDAGSVA